MIELDRKGLQVQVLFVPQIRHGKVADIGQVIHLPIGGERAVIGLHRLTFQKSIGDVLDVLAVVGVFRPFRVAWFETLRAQLCGVGQGLNLHPSIVVIKLAVHRPALCFIQVAQRITQSRLSAMAHMQGAGGVGRDKFHQQALAARGLLTKGVGCLQDLAHHLLLGLGLQAQV